MNFRDKFWFLSNMYPVDINMNINGTDYTFKNAEAAFQAQKDLSRINEFTNLTGQQAKALGRQVNMRPDWNTYRDKAMADVINAKFNQHPDLMQQLKAIQGPIQEDNTWKDMYWGVYNGQGQNKLGQILMDVRDKGSAQMKELYTSYYFNKDTAAMPNNYSISRSQPKGYNYDESLKPLLAPSNELLKGYKNGTIDQAMYTEQYNKYLDDNIDNIISNLNNLPEHAILNCWEPTDQFCHRHLLADKLNSTGKFNIQEYANRINNMVDQGTAQMGSVQIINGDLFSTDAPYILHQVNNRGVMGAGLARDIRADIGGQGFNKYRNYVLENGTNSLGKVIPTKSLTNPNRVYFNLVGQDGYGTDKQYTDYEALKTGLQSINNKLTPGTRLALPYGMGAGLGGGDWNTIEDIIRKYLTNLNVELYKFKK